MELFELLMGRAPCNLFCAHSTEDVPGAPPPSSLPIRHTEHNTLSTSTGMNLRSLYLELVAVITLLRKARHMEASRFVQETSDL